MCRQVKTSWWAEEHVLEFRSPWPALALVSLVNMQKAPFLAIGNHWTRIFNKTIFVWAICFFAKTKFKCLFLLNSFFFFASHRTKICRQAPGCCAGHEPAHHDEQRAESLSSCLPSSQGFRRNCRGVGEEKTSKIPSIFYRLTGSEPVFFSPLGQGTYAEVENLNLMSFYYME